jgi:endonuclease/exonuclease/phosphatase (EEP) superfamily protein YafD
MRHRRRGLSAAAVLLAMPVAGGVAWGEQRPITIDGTYADWAEVPVVYTDPTGDGTPGGIDLGRLWLADDQRFFFLRFEVGGEIDLSENNDLRLYLDTDADSGTGLSINGIGAELLWRFGQRTGTFYGPSGQTSVQHDDLRFRSGPTVESNVFEAAVGRDTLPDGDDPLFTGPLVRFVLLNNGGDQLPGPGQFLTYVLDVNQLPPDQATPLERQRPDDLRLATWNVQGDGLWNEQNEQRFGRQLVAVAPDVLCFQEINGHTAEETAAYVQQWIPAGPGRSWDSAGNGDCRTVSLHPILDAWPVDGNLVTLLDTTAVTGTPTLLVNAHLPCCANDTGRQAEIDALMAFIRQAQAPGGLVSLPPDSPVIIAGDLNLVGAAQQIVSLLTGDIVDEGTWGPDFGPDWDGSDLTSVVSRQTEKRMGYTWRNDNSSFWPGHLDFIIYSDHVLDQGRDFILYTPEMSPASLASYGLQADDSLASDHLLFCADLRPPAPSITGDTNGDGVVDVDDLTAVILGWGDCPPAPQPCPADLNDDGTVNVDDLTLIILNWT